MIYDLRFTRCAQPKPQHRTGVAPVSKFNLNSTVEPYTDANQSGWIEIFDLLWILPIRRFCNFVQRITEMKNVNFKAACESDRFCTLVPFSSPLKYHCWNTVSLNPTGKIFRPTLCRIPNKVRCRSRTAPRSFPPRCFPGPTVVWLRQFGEESQCKRLSPKQIRVANKPELRKPGLKRIKFPPLPTKAFAVLFCHGSLPRGIKHHR